MQFTVEPEIFQSFPGIRLPVAVAHGVNNELEAPRLAAAWEEAWVEARDEARPYGNAQSHPRVQPWRDHFRAQHVSPKEFPSSIEALLRRTLKGGDPFRINPMVDFYNTVSLHHTAPAGGFDLEQIDGSLELRRTRAGDLFLAMDAEAPLTVPEGEVAYADETTILTRHFVWRQARTGLIGASARSVFLVSEVLGELGPGVAEKVLDEFASGLRAYFAVAPLLFLVDEQQPSIAWESH
jgi:DNA/RNA-binding domain of Phe-tRNA-synthetase-like protein